MRPALIPVRLDPRKDQNISVSQDQTRLEMDPSLIWYMLHKCMNTKEKHVEFLSSNN